jgi:hypothetical protein
MVYTDSTMLNIVYNEEHLDIFNKLLLNDDRTGTLILLTHLLLKSGIWRIFSRKKLRISS